jgi:hypothetical protein
MAGCTVNGRSSLEGFVATFELEHGELVTVHRSSRGELRSAMLAAAVEDVLARWPEARLVCYSTPQTILADLRNRRWTAGGRPLQFPEVTAAGMAGRYDVLHPRFVSRSSTAERLRGRRRRAAS